LVVLVTNGAPGLVLLLALGAIGVAVLRRSQLGLTSLECVAYGGPAGIVGMSLVMLGLAVVAGELSVPLVIGCAVASVAGGLGLWLGRRPSTGARRSLSSADAGHALADSRTQTQGATVPTDPRGRAVGSSLADRWSRTRWPGPIIDWIPALLFVVVAIYQAHFWSQVLWFEDGALVSSQGNIWGDWGMHLGDVTSFLWGGNFPPTHPRLAGAPMSYHYLSSFTAAAMATLGLHPVLAMTTQSFLLFLCIIAGLYAFGLRVIGHRPAALLFVPLFLLGGGYGTVPLLARLDFSAAAPLGVLDQQVFDRGLLRDLGYHLPHAEYMFQAQRGFLYGLPLALLAISLLLMGVRRVHARANTATDARDAASTEAAGAPRQSGATRPDGLARREVSVFAAAGGAAGILPIGHFSTVYALMLAIPAVAVLSIIVWPRPSVARVGRSFVPLAVGWATFGAIWVALTVPQVLWVYGGGFGASSSLRVQWGWMAGDEPLWFFWLKNLGTFAILFPIAVFARGILDGVTRRFLLGFSGIFLFGNVFAFLQWDWNNALFFQYWMLSVAIFVAALMGKAWSRRRTDIVAHAAMTAVSLSIIGLGLLAHLNHVTTDDRWTLLDAEGLALAERIRAETPAAAVFVTGTQYTNPIAVLTGRRLVVGYTTWLRTQGLDYAEQERDVRAILRFDPGTPALLAEHAVDYVAIGPWEREELHADEGSFRERYLAAAETEHWAVFAISDRAIASLPSGTRVADAVAPDRGTAGLAGGGSAERQHSGGRVGD
jgi:hypothetical protein